MNAARPVADTPAEPGIDLSLPGFGGVNRTLTPRGVGGGAASRVRHYRTARRQVQPLPTPELPGKVSGAMNLNVVIESQSRREDAPSEEAPPAHQHEWSGWSTVHGVELDEELVERSCRCGADELIAEDCLVSAGRDSA